MRNSNPVRMKYMDEFLQGYFYSVTGYAGSFIETVLQTGGGLAQLVTSLVASTKLINAGPGLGWVTVCRRVNHLGM